jgi:hypothetical protein
MEFERIQQLASAAKVLRANSEQQRRRREQNAREFSEMLEENLEQDQEQESPSSAITAVQDTVSISSTGQVSAETLRAAGNLARISLAQRQMLDLFNPSFSTLADGPGPDPEAPTPSLLDEVV